MSSPPTDPQGAARVVVCDYNSMLQGVTGLLRMSGYAVFQAYDGRAAMELCVTLPHIRLLVINTTGAGVATPDLVRAIREVRPGLPVLHVGEKPIAGMPHDVAHLHQGFSAARLLEVVEDLV